VTLGCEAQLPWAESHDSGLLHEGTVADAERYRIILRLNFDL